MIDDPEKAEFLMAELKRHLPMSARISQRLMRTFEERSPDIPIPEKCNVVGVFYMGDEGGVVCSLDLGTSETKNAHLVSITHLGFDRNNPMFRQIEAYQRHRIKKLKRQGEPGD